MIAEDARLATSPPGIVIGSEPCVSVWLPITAWEPPGAAEMMAELASVAMADVLGVVWGIGVSSGSSGDGLLVDILLEVVGVESSGRGDVGLSLVDVSCADGSSLVFAPSGVEVEVGVLSGEDVEAIGATVWEGFADEVCVVDGSARTGSAVGDATGVADVDDIGTLPHSSPFVQGEMGTGGSYIPHDPPPNRWHVFHAPLKKSAVRPFYAKPGCFNLLCSGILEIFSKFKNRIATVLVGVMVLPIRN